MPTKAELLNEAEMLGLEVKTSMTKAQIADVIMVARTDGTLPPDEEPPVPVRADPPHPAKTRDPQKAPTANFTGKYRLMSRVRIGDTVHFPSEVVHLSDSDARTMLDQKACEPV